MSGRVAYSALAPDVLGQIFNPLTYVTTSSGQYGLVNIRYGQSSSPETERSIIENVAGYGKQIGRLLDAVEEIAKHLEKKEPSIQKITAIREFHELALAVAVTKATCAEAETIPLSEFIDALERLKKNNNELFEKVKEKLKTVL